MDIYSESGRLIHSSDIISIIDKKKLKKFKRNGCYIHNIPNVITFSLPTHYPHSERAIYENYIADTQCWGEGIVDKLLLYKRKLYFVNNKKIQDCRWSYFHIDKSKSVKPANKNNLILCDYPQPDFSSINEKFINSEVFMVFDNEKDFCKYKMKIDI